MMWIASGDYYVVTYTGSEIADLKEDNTSLVKKTATGDLIPGSYYNDRTNQYLYLYPTAGSPKSNNMTYVIYVWLGLTDHQSQDYRCEFAIQGLDAVTYLPILEITATLTQSISDLWEGHVQNMFHSITLGDPGWGYRNINNYIWENSVVVIKSGTTDDAYGDYVIIFTAVVTSKSLSSSGMVLSLRDIRSRYFREIPTVTLGDLGFTRLPDDTAGEPARLAVGPTYGDILIRVDTLYYIYHAALTDFNGVTFPLSAISAVYLDGVALTYPTDYSYDLSAGTVTLVSDPGDGEITADIQGIKLGYDFDTPEYTDAYSTNLADWLNFLLREVLGVPTGYIDCPSFKTLQEAVTDIVADYIETGVDFQDYLKILQITGQFSLLPDATGLLKCVVYETSSEPTATLNTESIDNLVETTLGKGQYTGIGVTYGGGQRAYYGDDSILYKYGVPKVDDFESILVNEEDAQDLAYSLLSMWSRPPRAVRFQTDHEAMTWQPLSDKVRLNYTIEDDSGEYQVYESKDFIIMGLVKNFYDKITVTAIPDIGTSTGLCLLDGDGLVLLDGDGLALLY